MIADITILAAFAAGVVSFLSPCVLPLVPPYLSFLAGASLEELTENSVDSVVRRRVIVSALLFVLGFSTVFIMLGATASFMGELLREYLDILAKIAGVTIIIMGLHFLGVFKLGFLNRDTRYQHSERPRGMFGSYAIGVAFAFGWTPCIGPVLGAILSVAATEDSVSQGAILLGIYSAGLGVPFLASAYGINGFLRFIKRFRRHLGTVEKIMGGLLVLTGIMFLTGTMQRLSYFMLEMFPGLATLG
ncbi:Cytochrome c-type biogenesis protein CcdA (DsbD analog) [hydrothermal vent metagenome]|uniref:Cytochrome c-type biogenesis protein CcdA (DsbD analog) n=1 Tax=hydrothermal vent metagenome TaxID=652676 RepID=A0A3B0SH03_9ZZZZ